jgi:hypothetical protein
LYFFAKLLETKKDLGFFVSKFKYELKEYSISLALDHAIFPNSLGITPMILILFTVLPFALTVAFWFVNTLVEFSIPKISSYFL